MAGGQRLVGAGGAAVQRPARQQPRGQGMAGVLSGALPEGHPGLYAGLPPCLLAQSRSSSLRPVRLGNELITVTSSPVRQARHSNEFARTTRLSQRRGCLHDELVTATISSARRARHSDKFASAMSSSLLRFRMRNKLVTASSSPA